MNNRIGNLSQYLSSLFGDWLTIISNVVTLVSLIIGLWNETKLPHLFSFLPKEVYITLSFLTFAIANFRVYSKANKNDSSFNFQITKVDAGIPSDVILYNGQDFSFYPEVKFRVATRIKVTNVGGQTAVLFSTEAIKPFSLEELHGLETTLSRIGSGGTKLENPYYFRSDDMFDDIQVSIQFSIALETLEKIFSALGKVKHISPVLSATPTGKKAILRQAEGDLSSAFKNTVEERIPKIAQRDMPTAIKAFSLMKRYWLGPE